MSKPLFFYPNISILWVRNIRLDYVHNISKKGFNFGVRLEEIKYHFISLSYGRNTPTKYS